MPKLATQSARIIICKEKCTEGYIYEVLKKSTKFLRKPLKRGFFTSLEQKDILIRNMTSNTNVNIIPKDTYDSMNETHDANTILDTPSHDAMSMSLDTTQNLEAFSEEFETSFIYGLNDEIETNLFSTDENPHRISEIDEQDFNYVTAENQLSDFNYDPDFGTFDENF